MHVGTAGSDTLGRTHFWGAAMSTLTLANESMFETVNTMDALRDLMGFPAAGAIKKDIARIDEHFAAFIARSPFALLSTAGATGRCDVSPKGDGPGFVQVLDGQHIAIPDRPGNKRLDSLTNIVETGQAGIIFLIPGIEDTLRINGRASITVDTDLLDSMAVDGKPPKLAIIIEVQEAYLHCAKAFRRSRLWDPAHYAGRDEVASAGCMIVDQMNLDGVTGEQVDANLELSYRDHLY